MEWERQRTYDREAGREEGRAEGRAEGERNKALEDARSLLANGVSPEIIAKSIGMELEEVLALREE